MNIVFRVDSSYSIGGGYRERCLSLANELSNNGVNSLLSILFNWVVDFLVARTFNSLNTPFIFSETEGIKAS